MTDIRVWEFVREADCLLVHAGSLTDLYRKLDRLARNGRGGWTTLRSPFRVESRLVCVLVRPDLYVEDHQPEYHL